MPRRLLSIETSCDETAVALLEDTKIIAEKVATQEIHSKWGGVVPELASRLHQKVLSRMTNDVLEDAGWTFSDIDGIAATHGPGLVGALLVGVSYAKGIAVACGIPFIPVNHLEGHIWAASADGQEMELDSLALLVSGGHTELFKVKGFGDYQFIGGTLDDAAGEAFDKVGVLLGLHYPAGAEISKLADDGDPKKFFFKIAETSSPFDFSFSGLKSAVMRKVLEVEASPYSGWKNDIAASFQHSVVSQIAGRVERVLKKGQYRSFMIGGGVAANKELRDRLKKLTKRFHVDFLYPPMNLCTDNAAMIGYVGAKLDIPKDVDSNLTAPVDPNLTLVDED